MTRSFLTLSLQYGLLRPAKQRKRDQETRYRSSSANQEHAAVAGPIGEKSGQRTGQSVGEIDRKSVV